jgi:hypothetical protein
MNAKPVKYGTNVLFCLLNLWKAAGLPNLHLDVFSVQRLTDAL